jgi:hypothetical protein
MSQTACIVSFFVCPEVVVVIHESQRAPATEYATIQWNDEHEDHITKGC